MTAAEKMILVCSLMNAMVWWLLLLREGTFRGAHENTKELIALFNSTVNSHWEIIFELLAQTSEGGTVSKRDHEALVESFASLVCRSEDDESLLADDGSGRTDPAKVRARLLSALNRLDALESATPDPAGDREKESPNAE